MLKQLTFLKIVIFILFIFFVTFFPLIISKRINDIKSELEQCENQLLIANVTSNLNITPFNKPLDFEEDCIEIGGDPYWVNNGWRSCYIYEYTQLDVYRLTVFCKLKHINEELVITSKSITCGGFI